MKKVLLTFLLVFTMLALASAPATASSGCCCPQFGWRPPDTACGSQPFHTCTLTYHIWYQFTPFTACYSLQPKNVCSDPQYGGNPDDCAAGGAIGFQTLSAAAKFRSQRL